jgi:hypothetical protein
MSLRMTRQVQRGKRGIYMGASGWEYRTPYAHSVEQSLRGLQMQVIAEGDYIWPWEEFDEDNLEDDEGVARPTSLEELEQARSDEDFWEGGGTHSILDVDAEQVSPLTATDLVGIFGTEQPSAADFERVHVPGLGGVLGELIGDKWTGRSLVLFTEGVPAEVCFWGWSGD